MFTVYMLECADGAFYVGYTGDVARRVDQHNAGSGSAYTAARRPVKLVFREEHPDRVHAIARERQLKRWTHAKKQLLATHGSSAVRHWSARGNS